MVASLCNPNHSSVFSSTFSLGVVPRATCNKMHRASSRRLSPKSGRFLNVAIHPIVMVEAELVIVFTRFNIAITAGTTQECSLAPHMFPLL